MEFQVRAARITDIDRIVALGDDGALSPERGPLHSADLLRQLVYLPQASVLVAEARRELVGGAVLALRPSVRAGGYVGTIDVLLVSPEQDAERVTTALVEELLRSASNKGCTIVEVACPQDPVERAAWERLGFDQSGVMIERAVTAVGGSGRRPR